MTQRTPREDRFDHLSTSEKILLVQDLWDEIARNPDDVHLTPAQAQELERRLRNHEESPGKYTSWEDLRARLESEGR